jgi:hypothetical protein
VNTTNIANYNSIFTTVTSADAAFNAAGKVLSNKLGV